MIFLGCNYAIRIWKDVLKRSGTTCHGIVDSDYYGNVKKYKNIPVIGTEKDMESVIENHAKFIIHDGSNDGAGTKAWCSGFFIGTNWDPAAQTGTARNNEKRQRLIELAEKWKLPMGSIIDPTAIVPSDVKIGKGVYIGAGVVIEPGVTIGDYTQIWHQTIVGHDTKIGRDCVLQRRSGLWNAMVGDHVYMSIGSVYGGKYKKSSIGDNAWIWPGVAVQTRNIVEGETVTIREQFKRRAQPVGM